MINQWIQRRSPKNSDTPTSFTLSFLPEKNTGFCVKQTIFIRLATLQSTVIYHYLFYSYNCQALHDAAPIISSGLHQRLYFLHLHQEVSYEGGKQINTPPRQVKLKRLGWTDGCFGTCLARAPSNRSTLDLLTGNVSNLAKLVWLSPESYTHTHIHWYKSLCDIRFLVCTLW